MDFWSKQNVSYDVGALLQPIAQARLNQGRLIAVADELDSDQRRELTLDAMADEITARRNLDNAPADRQQVLALLHGRDMCTVTIATREAIERRDEPLTREMLFAWHECLNFGSAEHSYSGRLPGDPPSLRIGSSLIYKPILDWRSPLEDFLVWYNGVRQAEGLLTAGLAKVGFLKCSPFKFGNEAIAGAIANHALARSAHLSEATFSLAHQIQSDRNTYEEALVSAVGQHDSNLDRWLSRFVTTVSKAIEYRHRIYMQARLKAHSRRHQPGRISERLQATLDKLRQSGPTFKSRDWQKLTLRSSATCGRDLKSLVERGVLERQGGSKNTVYIFPAD